MNLKIKEEFDLSLLDKYGFQKTDPKEYQRFDEDYTLSHSLYIYQLGHLRRGQRYYLLIDSKRQLNLYSTKPDGDGCTVVFDTNLINTNLINAVNQMLLDKIFEEEINEVKTNE